MTTIAAPAEGTPSAGLAQELAAYVGGVPVTPFLEGCIRVASESVGHHIGGAHVPEATRARAILEVAAELYHRRSAPNGIKNYADGFDGVAAVRVARDAMVAARPLLAPYLSPAIA